MTPKPDQESAILYLATEAVFHRDPFGKIWSKDIHDNSFWLNYLKFFDHIIVVARVKNGMETAPNSMAIDDQRVAVLALPHYKGAAGFMSAAPRLAHILWTETKTVKTALLRLPGPLGSLLGMCLVARRVGFAVELVGDVDEVMGTSNFSIATKLARLPLKWVTQILCKKAYVISYVTSRTLQKKYGANRTATQFACSDVKLEPSDFARHPREKRDSSTAEAVFCGSLAQMYKGLDVLIRAVGILRHKKILLHVKVIGDGVYRAELERLAGDNGVADQFTFVGQITRVQVMQALESADLFVMPSRTEGLPRALVEAMAKGLPCIASNVGGIPELLSQEVLVAPNDVRALAVMLERFLQNPRFMNSEAERNLGVAKKHFSIAHLELQRNNFLAGIRNNVDEA